ncbi:hypothetical protein GCM10009075_06760 [Sphingomonas trueperi]
MHRIARLRRKVMRWLAREAREGGGPARRFPSAIGPLGRVMGSGCNHASRTVAPPDPGKGM